MTDPTALFVSCYASRGHTIDRIRIETDIGQLAITHESPYQYVLQETIQTAQELLMDIHDNQQDRHTKQDTKSGLHELNF